MRFLGCFACLLFSLSPVERCPSLFWSSTDLIKSWSVIFFLWLFSSIHFSETEECVSWSQIFPCPAFLPFSSSSLSYAWGVGALGTRLCSTCCFPAMTPWPLIWCRAWRPVTTPEYSSCVLCSYSWDSCSSSDSVHDAMYSLNKSFFLLTWSHLNFLFWAQQAKEASWQLMNIHEVKSQPIKGLHLSRLLCVMITGYWHFPTEIWKFKFHKFNIVLRGLSHGLSVARDELGMICNHSLVKLGCTYVNVPCAFESTQQKG